MHAKLNLWIIIASILQGERAVDSTGHAEKIDMPSITLFHEELDNEDYLFRTDLDELWSLMWTAKVLNPH